MFALQFPTKADWLTYKRQRCCQCLSITDCEAMLEKVGKDKKCSATLDWLIAAYAHAEDCLLITDDKGVEFKQIACKATVDDLEKVLSACMKN